jgi:hypothetical protein
VAATGALPVLLPCAVLDFGRPGVVIVAGAAVSRAITRP